MHAPCEHRRLMTDCRQPSERYVHPPWRRRRTVHAAAEPVVKAGLLRAEAKAGLCPEEALPLSVVRRRVAVEASEAWRDV